MAISSSRRSSDRNRRAPPTLPVTLAILSVLVLSGMGAPFLPLKKGSLAVPFTPAQAKSPLIPITQLLANW